MTQEKRQQYVLGFSRGRSGAFEHAWALAQNLQKKEYPTSYCSNWWDVPPIEIDLQTEEKYPLDPEFLKDLEGVLHLQTHTWEHEGLLDLVDEDKTTMIYGLHAIISLSLIL